MNWIKQNKFLTGFLAVTLIGAGVLAFLMLSAKGKADEAEQHYSAAAAELTRLQNSAPFPDEGNLRKMEELKKAHHAAIEELQKNLAATQIPLEPTTPAQFQDKLKETVTKIKSDAGAKNVKLPEKFYMSFDKYETEPPKSEAAAPLLRMLKAMELVVEMLIDNQVSEIGDFKRDALPEEAGKKEGGKNAAKDESGKALVVRHPFEVGFVAHEGKFHKFINNLITEKKQFYIPRSVVVKNEKEQGPSRTAPQSPTPPAPTPAPANPNAPNTPSAPVDEVRLVVGEEKLQVVVKIDVIDFAEIAAPAKADK
jgi:hypothetical protein